MSSPSTRPKPFSLPEYTRALIKFVHEGVDRLMEAKDEVWAMIPKAEPSERLPVTQNTMPSGEVVQNFPAISAAEFVFILQDIRSCNTDELAVQMDGAADQNLSVFMPHFFEVLGRTSQAAGTASDAGGRPFGFELYLETLEKIDMQFDENGKPELPTLIVSPQLARQIQALPPTTPKQQKLLEELISRKRKEFNARRRNRNLR